MSDRKAALTAYNNYRKQHPEQFINPPDAAFELVADESEQLKVGAGIMYQDDYSILLRDAVRFRNGEIRPYTRVMPANDHGGAAVLPLLEDKIVLLNHQRHATRASHWEIPRGFAEANEPPEDTARREIREELEVAELELVYLGRVHPDTGASSGCTTLYLARLGAVGKLEREEGIDSIRIVTLSDFSDMVRGGEVTDSFTLAAAFQASLRALF